MDTVKSVTHMCDGGAHIKKNHRGAEEARLAHNQKDG